MPVAALIVVSPGIEVKAIKSDSLCADGDRRQARAHVAIETVFVHSDILWRIPQSNESGYRSASCILTEARVGSHRGAHDRVTSLDWP